MIDPIQSKLRGMIVRARGIGKAVPTMGQLKFLLWHLDGMKCPTCKVVMGWNRVESGAKTICLQHDRSGAFRLLCISCNTAHGAMPGDSFYDGKDVMKDEHLPHAIPGLQKKITRVFAAAKLTPEAVEYVLGIARRLKPSKPNFSRTLNHILLTAKQSKFLQ